MSRVSGVSASEKNEPVNFLNTSEELALAAEEVEMFAELQRLQKNFKRATARVAKKSRLVIETQVFFKLKTSDESQGRDK